jgi:hypothetical protein
MVYDASVLSNVLLACIAVTNLVIMAILYRLLQK